MLIITIIFFIAIISLFGMMMFRVWEIKKLQTEEELSKRKIVPEIYFRHVEKIMLYLAKHIIQTIVLLVVKGYFILSTKTKRWAGKNWPKVYKFFRKDKEVVENPTNSFFQKAVMESKAKIRSIKEKVRKDHGGK